MNFFLLTNTHTKKRQYLGSFLKLILGFAGMRMRKSGDTKA